MKKIVISLFFLLGIVSFTYAQKWEFGVDAGLFRNTGSNTAEGSGGNFSGIWNINSSVYPITNYKVGLFMRRNIAKFYVGTGASVNFNQQINVEFENIEPSDPNYGDYYINGYKVQTISVPVVAGFHIYKGFGFQTGITIEFDVINRKNQLHYPPITYEVNAINKAFSNSYMRYTAGLFYQYKRLRVSFDYLRDLGWIVHEIPYEIEDHGTMPAETTLFLKTNSFTFTIGYSLFSK
jgi:hypothetical protein